MTAQTAKPDVWDVRDRLDENFQRVQQIIDSLMADSDPNVRLQAAAEARHNIALAEKANAATVEAEAARMFEDTVIEILANASPTLRKEFIRRINERQQTWRSKYDRRPRNP